MDKGLANSNKSALPGPSVNYNGLLRDVFSPVSRCIDVVDPRQSLALPNSIFMSCWHLHDLSQKLVTSLEAVFNNYEHSLIVNEGYDLGYNMPNAYQWHSEVAAFKEFLSEFKPKEARSDDEFAIVSLKQAAYINSLAHYAEFMLSRIFTDMFQSDYLKTFQNHRKAGYKYQGADVGRQVSNCYSGLLRLKNRVAQHEALTRSIGDIFANAPDIAFHEMWSDLA